MRRLLLPALAIALLAGTFAGVASARFADGGARQPTAAPFHAPAAMPREGVAQPGAYAFRSTASIGAQVERETARSSATSASATAPAGAGARITVTAVVLPVVFIIVDEQGDVVELITNTDERRATGVVYLVRQGGADGSVVPLDPSTWTDARAAMLDANAGTGSIWHA